MSECQCETCVMARRYEAAIEAKDFDAMSQLAKDAMNALCMVGEDACYYKAILEGYWPSSERQLTEALAKARSMKLEHPDWPWHN